MEPDEEVAGRLEAVAAAASDRRGHVAAAAMFERAARLTPEDEPRARRLYLAAHSAWLAGQGDRALRLLDDAAPAGATTPPSRRLATSRAGSSFAGTPPAA